MMKKYLLITALCAVNFAYADGFENLKNLQNQFHVLIYKAGDLGAATPAPEVPYIAGLLTNPVQTIGTGEESHIYEFLYDQPSGRNRKAIPGIDQAKANAFNRVNFNVFQTYNPYQDSGHSVLGVAAQEQLPPIEKVTIMSAVPRASPIVVNSSSSSSNAPTGAGLFAGGGPFELPKLRKATTKEPSTSVSATVRKSLLERVQEHKKTLKKQVDIDLLTELETELSRGASEASLASDRYNELVEFFNLLTTQDPGMKDVLAQHKLDNDIKTLRARLRPKEVKNDTASPAPIVAIGGLSMDPAHVNHFINKSTASRSVKKAASLGNTEVDTLSKTLENLKERKEELESDDSDEGWDDDEDTKPKKSAQELKQEQDQLKMINAQILEKAEALAIHPEGRLDLILDEMDGKNAIYQRIYNHLEDSTNRSKNQDDVYQQITAKLRSLNGGMRSRQSAVGAGGTSSATANVPAVAVGNIDSQSVQNHIVDLTQILDAQADDSYQKDRYLSAINEYLQGLIARGAEGAEDRKAYLNRLHGVLEGVETTPVVAKKRADVSKALGELKATIKKELASQK